MLLQFTALLQSWTLELVCGSDIADSLPQQHGELETLLAFDVRQSDSVTVTDFTTKFKFWYQLRIAVAPRPTPASAPRTQKHYTTHY